LQATPAQTYPRSAVIITIVNILQNCAGIGSTGNPSLSAAKVLQYFKKKLILLSAMLLLSIGS